jgi:hypothetical protein
MFIAIAPKKFPHPSVHNLNHPPPPFRRDKAGCHNTILRPTAKESDLHQNLILTAISDNLTDKCGENSANEFRMSVRR